MADVAAAVPRQAVSADVFRAIVREIPQLEEDKQLLALLTSSVDANVETCLQVMQHQIDLSTVQAPAAAVEYARRLAQRGTPLTTLLRTYRLGHARFSDWLLKELARHADAGPVISAATVSMSQDRGRLHRPDLGGDGRGLHPGAGALAAESERGQGRQGPPAAVR